MREASFDAESSESILRFKKSHNSTSFNHLDGGPCAWTKGEAREGAVERIENISKARAIEVVVKGCFLLTTCTHALLSIQSNNPSLAIRTK